jgi:hypothetical protein
MAESQPSPPAAPPVVIHLPPPRSRWPVAAVLIVLIVALVGVPAYFVHRALQTAGKLANTPGKLLDQAADALRGAFGPQVQVTTVLHSSVAGLHTRPKLVVLTAEIAAEITKTSETKTFWGYVNFGTTQVRLRAAGNRVQYVIPLGAVTARDFRYDPARQVLIVTVPAPRLDEEMIAVQTDPKQIEVTTQNGWAKLDRYSGAPLREEARRELRAAVLAEGAHELLRDKARSSAGPTVKGLLAPLAESLREGVRLEVEFR